MDVCGPKCLIEHKYKQPYRMKKDQ